MRTKEAAGMPLARRALDPAELDRQRAAGPALPSERIGRAPAVPTSAFEGHLLGTTSSSASTISPVISIELLQRGVHAAVCGLEELPNYPQAQVSDNVEQVQRCFHMHTTSLLFSDPSAQLQENIHTGGETRVAGWIASI
jgi:hypothetical protein